MKTMRVFFCAIATVTLIVVNTAIAQDATPTTSPTPKKGQCRSFDNKLRAFNKQLSTQEAKKSRTQKKLDEVNAQLAALPTATPTPTPTASVTAAAVFFKHGNHDKNGHGDDGSALDGKDLDDDSDDKGKKPEKEEKKQDRNRSALEKLRDNLVRKIEKVVDRIAKINEKIAEVTAKKALCPTPTPTATPTPSASATSAT